VDLISSSRQFAEVVENLERAGVWIVKTVSRTFKSLSVNGVEFLQPALIFVMNAKQCRLHIK